MPRLSDKTVLITGASKGIGRVLALGCARDAIVASAKAGGRWKAVNVTASPRATGR